MTSIWPSSLRLYSDMRPETGIESAEVSSRDRFTMILLGKWWRKTRKLYGQIVVSQEYVQGYYRGFRKDRMMISSFEISFWEQSGEYGGKDLKLGKYFRGLHVGTWQDCLLRTLSLRQVFFAVPIYSAKESWMTQLSSSQNIDFAAWNWQNIWIQPLEKNGRIWMGKKDCY